MLIKNVILKSSIVLFVSLFLIPSKGDSLYKYLKHECVLRLKIENDLIYHGPVSQIGKVQIPVLNKTLFFKESYLHIHMVKHN